MDLNSLLKIIDRQLIESNNRPLNSTEITILRGIWQYQTYIQIAIEAGYSPGYFTTVVAPELYQRLAKIIGQRVTKKNCRMLLESHICQGATSQTEALKQEQTRTSTNIDRDILPPYPSGSVPLSSPFYLKRSLEKQIEGEIGKPGALIRIKAPKEMGPGDNSISTLGNCLYRYGNLCSSFAASWGYLRKTARISPGSQPCFRCYRTRFLSFDSQLQIKQYGVN